ncbi:DUF721 domain-containing protein [Methyloceanibacter caenitepidi]|uniref:Zn-ribbon-containing, possibly RNA-binding protein and truncated derivatives n=1 Tax=Methyloceanibacter caenitepidi TaxID=1384459 RepID=A0A0A8K127_9HYPH|nr:DciA family protein [Methyloceanibacter caenitepidi]BAQ16476.1 Zn-ribbon-containing, possibly RNA-binding protein and truncated derivatives [Methyloceanibacter caenitepidi]
MNRPPRKPSGPVRKTGARPIGSFVEKALDEAARARGFATTALLSDWRAIAGAELARYTMPDRIIWPRRRDNWEDETADNSRARGHRRDGATLVLRIEGPRAIEVQHRATQILERINAYFGYRAVTEMRFLQAPISRVARPKRMPKPPLPAYALPKSAGIQDKGLARALDRLGALAKHCTESERRRPARRS